MTLRRPARLFAFVHAVLLAAVLSGEPALAASHKAQRKSAAAHTSKHAKPAKGHPKGAASPAGKAHGKAAAKTAATAKAATVEPDALPPEPLTPPHDSGPPPPAPYHRASPDKVRLHLGDPDIARAEAKGAMWTYRLKDCALFIFFQDEGDGLRVTGMAAGPRRRGEAALSAASCLTTAIDLNP